MSSGTIAVTALLWLTAQTPPAEFRAPANWTQAIEPFAIAEGLYWVGTADLSSYLFTSDDGHVLIDAPLEENVDRVLASIRKLGFDPADVNVLLASHGHFDHTGGMATMMERTGASLVLSTAEARLVGAGGKGDFFLGDTAAYRPAKATRRIANLDSIRIGNHKLTAHITPGHTKGCTSWSGTVKIAGEKLDFVSICSLSVLPGYRLWGDAPSYPGIARDYCSSVAHLRTLEPDIFLGAHGSFIGLAEKVQALTAGNARAFVDPEGYKEYLDHAQRQIEKTLAEQGHTGGCQALLAVENTPSLKRSPSP